MKMDKTAHKTNVVLHRLFHSITKELQLLAEVLVILQ